MNMLAIALGNLAPQEAPKKRAPKLAYEQYEQLLIDNPGSTFSELAKLAGRTETRTMQALAYIRRRGKVVSGVAPDGRYVHYHVTAGTRHSLGLRLREKPRARAVGIDEYLNFVQENPGCTADDVAKAFGIAKGTAGRALHGLALDSLLRYTRSASNTPKQYFVQNA